MNRFPRFWAVMLPALALIAAGCAARAAEGQDTAAPFTALQPVDLRCEDLTNPVGVDAGSARLSWRIPPGERGRAQSAYQILAASTQENLDQGRGDLLQTPKVFSIQSHLVPYTGRVPAPGEICWWKVRVWNERGEVSQWSEPAFFVAGIAAEADWNGAAWMGADWFEDFSGPLPLFRKTLNLSAPPRRAVLHVCALGHFDGWINSARVGDAALDPAVTDYGKRGLTRAFDVTGLLRAGRNAVGIRLARGWHSAISRRAGLESPVVRVRLQAWLENGEQVECVSGGDWKMAPGEVTPLGKMTSGDYGGETIDAQKTIENWTDPDYSDSDWKPAALPAVPPIAFTPQAVEPNRVIDTFPAVSVSEPEPGLWLIDMGRNYTGRLRLALGGAVGPGGEVKLEYADCKRPDGSWQTYSQRDVYIARGDGTDVFENRFAYHAFRWVLVKGLARAPRPEDATGLQISTDYASAATFACDNPLLQRTWETMRHTFRCLSLGGYTVDCPHRERLGYGGDSGTSMEGAMMNFSLGPLYRKWAYDWRDAQIENGDVPYTAPHAQDAGGGPAWSGFCVSMPWMTWIINGDDQPIREGYPVMKRWLQFIETRMRDGILQPYVGVGCAGSPEWNFLGDWVPPGREQGGNRVDDRSTLFFNNCYLVYALQAAEQVARYLGHAEDADQFRRKADALARTLHERFLNPDGVTYANGEQPYLAMPLLFGITPPDKRDAVFRALEKDILETRGGKLNTGMHGTYFMTRLLIESGRNDLLARIFGHEEYPGYGYMFRNGATTIWEEWDGENSQIHNTLLSPMLWFIEGLGGIRPDPAYPGFREFILRPGLESGLGRVDASYRCPYGRIACRWVVDNGTVTVEAEIPPCTAARFTLPGVDPASVREGDRAPDEAEGLLDVQSAGNEFSCRLLSGSYRFTAKRK